MIKLEDGQLKKLTAQVPNRYKKVNKSRPAQKQVAWALKVYVLNITKTIPFLNKIEFKIIEQQKLKNS